MRKLILSSIFILITTCNLFAEEYYSFFSKYNFNFITEEAGNIRGKDKDHIWIIDPIDGTTNFMHGIPHFAISIAVQDPKPDGSGWGDIFAGLVYNPITDESFWAERGKGAWLGNRRLRVSARRQLNEALIATGTS